MFELWMDSVVVLLFLLACRSVMTGEEQLHAVEALTEAISRKLGLREQLDVIRIIDPSASVDPTADREFVVGQSSSGFFPDDLASLELQ